MNPKRLIALVVASVVPAFTEAATKVTVSSPNLDRRETVVLFQLPAGVEGNLQLLDDQNNEIPLQVVAPAGEGAKMGAFVMRDLNANQTRTYLIEPSKEIVTKTGSSPAALAVAEGRVEMTVRGKTVLKYHGTKTPLPEGYEAVFQRGGYIHPVVTPSGVEVSDDYPSNHKHHHGIWSPWTKTAFEGRQPDFWNMGTKTGTVEFVALDERSARQGPYLASFVTKHRMVDLSAKPEPKAALDEQWVVTAYNVGGSKERPFHVFDVTMTQTCASQSALQLPKYHYGGLGFRGHWDWNGKEACSFLTSEGKTRADGNETRARWTRISGKVGGKAASIVIMDAPTNFRHPQPVRLHPTEPFFCYAPSQLGDWAIEPGKPYVATYRFVVADGEIAKEEIEKLYGDFATPVTVKVE